LIVAFNFPPKGWALCNGQLLPINQNQALFSILGTTYGGNGQTNFALPDFRGRVGIHQGPDFVFGQRAGEESHTLIQSEMPAHVHPVAASSDNAIQKTAPGNYWAANSGRFPYASQFNTTMSPLAISNVGGGQPHENRSPYLVLNYVICLSGNFPSQN
jgi:microcystin-dependent protein